MNSSFPKAARKGIFSKEAQKNPSPSKYFPKPVYMIGNQNKGFSIQGKDANTVKTKDNLNPGPGTYFIQKE